MARALVIVASLFRPLDGHSSRAAAAAAARSVNNELAGLQISAERVGRLAGRNSKVSPKSLRRLRLRKI
jgi:hypothetical protein